ncbi:RNA 2'-phosphotransferase [Halomicroarcula sp. GCM10025817]|uniref:RNA 2'-phosphotransferase n=1 Tax=Haloarcula TaxID=2237 RepID=UPI0023E7A94B|nr:RNA 2'-phosphotransferase [Halomicroarcula sp. SYNS111]
MPDAIARCPTHGYHEGTTCPDCGAESEHVLDGAHRRRLSKFASGALRHFPDDADIELDAAGWTPFDALVAAVEEQYDWATREHVAGVVATDPKDRFEVAGDGENRPIRAAYGHSVDVDLEAGDGVAPDELYHGTAPRNLDAIFDEGLRPMGRQQVHLSATVADAREVGSRHAADPVVLAVDAAAMTADGHNVVERGVATYTTDRVPPRHLTRID